MSLIPVDITNEIIRSISLEVWDQENNIINWVTAVNIKTAKSKLSIVVNPDLDELIINTSTDSAHNFIKSPDASVIGVEDIAPLRDLVNKKVVWLWTLTNNQGYQDGFQIEVANGQDPILIQFMAEGSKINIYRLGRS